jgi:hypothetical protein
MFSKCPLAAGGGHCRGSCENPARAGTFAAVNRLAVFAACLSLFAAAVEFASGHPTINDSMEFVIHADRIAVRAKISLPEIDIAHTIDESAGSSIDPAKLKTAVDAHAAYLLSHLRVTGDDATLQGKVLNATPPAGELTWSRIDQLEAVYDIEYPMPRSRPATVRIEQDLLKEFSRLGEP